MTDIIGKKIVKCEHCGVLFEVYRKSAKTNKLYYDNYGLKKDGKYYCNRGTCIHDRMDKREQDEEYQTFKDTKQLTIHFLNNLSKDTLVEGILLREQLYQEWLRNLKENDYNNTTLQRLQKEKEKLEFENERILNNKKRFAYVKDLKEIIKDLRYKNMEKFNKIQFLKTKIKTEKGRTKNEK